MSHLLTLEKSPERPSSRDHATAGAGQFAAVAWRLFLAAQCLAIVATAVYFRGWQLGNVPGINGDEAWYGVQCEMLLHGEPFSWRTPTGNPLNPFFFAPLLILHAFAEPSFALLRVAPLASGLLALVANFFLCRRAFDVRTAITSTVALAVLPINIAYGRFAWDASQSLLFTLPVIYAPFIAATSGAARAKWSAVGVFALFAALLVHPTNVFVAPWLVIGLAFAWSDRLRDAWTQNRGACVTTAIASSTIGVAAVLRYWPRIAGHVVSPENYSAFATDFAGLFSGVTVYQYIAGTLGPDARDPRAALTTEIAMAFVTAFFAGLVAFAYYRRIRRGRSSLDLILAAAWTSCVAAFFLVAGPEAIRPHFERYAICLIAPTIALSARGLHWWMQPSTRFSFATAPLLIVLAWASLFVFKQNYFDEFTIRGGNSHRTFRTSAVEPKQAALALILERSPTDEPVQISTSQWWLYWPLRYLAYVYDHVHVEQRNADDSRSIEQHARHDRDHWIVEFAEAEAGWRLKQKKVSGTFSIPPIDVECHTIRDAANRPLLFLFRIPATDR